jgi:predicted negative regulator of RcsB-dependent stress response
MADDYLSDSEQEEALRSWWRDNWRWILGGVVLGLALLIGWRYWESRTAQRGEQAAQVYADLQSALAKNDLAQADRLLTDLVQEHRGLAYAELGRLLVARAHIEVGKLDAAVPLLQAVADSADDDELVRVAQLRLVRVLIQQGKYDDALARLKMEEKGGFAAQVRELRGDALFAKGDLSGARAEYAAALAANADAQIDRPTLELKLQDVGGDAPASANSTTSAITGAQGAPQP